MIKITRCLIMAAFLLLATIAQAGEITGKMATATGGPIKNGVINFTLTQPAVVATGTSNPWVGGTCATGQVATGVLSNGTPICSAGAHNLLSATHLDTTAATVLRGALVTGQGATPTWSLLALGATNSVLCSNGSDALWSSVCANSVTTQITPPIAGTYAILYPTTESHYVSGPGTPEGFVTASAGGSALINRVRSCGLCDWDVWAYWSGFALPAYVSPSSVTAVYAIQSSTTNTTDGTLGTHEISACQGTVSFSANINCTGTEWGFSAWPGQQSTLLASGGAAASFNFATTSIAADNASSLSFTGDDQWQINTVALVVFYGGTQQAQNPGVQVVYPLAYNTALNTLSMFQSSANADGWLASGDWSTFNAKASVGTPTVGKAACIKSAGPPVVIGYCSTVVDSAGDCTCN